MTTVKTSKKLKRKLYIKIVNFYINLWFQRKVGLTKYKYSYAKAWNNIHSVLSFFNESFDNKQLKKATIKSWRDKGLYEIRYKKWHFAVSIQLDIFENYIAIIQDCVHDKDYHNDTIQTSPFEMDSPDDKSHLVDWKEYKLDRLISESIKNSIDKIMKSKNNNTKYEIKF